MKLELAVSCHQFQHRFCWMLSSLLQQRGEQPELIVNAAYIENTGDPTTADLLYFFESEGLTVKHTPYPDKEEFQYRGLVRNRQLAETEADWIWFGDCDMVVHPDYITQLYDALTIDYFDEQRMLHSGRFSTDKPPDATNRLVEGFTYPCVVPDAYELSNGLKKHKKSNKGAGFCQIANVKVLREKHGGLYVDPSRNPDFSWSKYSRCRSDVQFRRRLGRQAVDLPRFIHLQHIRDNEIGHHTEVQR